MSDRTLHERLAALSPEARALLARRLGPHAIERRTTAGSDRLVAYYEPREGTPVPADELRRLLLEQLPQFMVPSRFIPMEKLPLLPAGKVNRQALRERRDDLVVRTTPSTGPASEPAAQPTADEETDRLLGIWRDVLGRPAVGLGDDFFEAGGDSIVAMRLIARAARAGLRVTLAEFFSAPTVSGMLAAARTRGLISAAPRPPAARARMLVPLTPIQHWFFEQDFARAAWWNQVQVIEIAADLDDRSLEIALNALVDHHDALRLAFVRKAGGWQQHVEPLSASVSIQRVEVTADDRRARESAVEQPLVELQAAMRLDSGLLLRAVRLSSPGGACASDVLYLVAHHLAVDVVSWDILLDDLENAYDQLESGQPIVLTPATPFSEWADALFAYAQDPERHRERSWWFEAAGTPPPPLPRDLSGSPNDEASADVFITRLDAAETERLLDLVRSAVGNSVSDVILAGLLHSIANWSGSSTIRVGIEGHGRTDLVPAIDVSRTVGWFTTYWPMTFDLATAKSLTDVLRTVATRMQAVGGGGLGYGVLRYLTADDVLTREMAAVPAPEVVFNYLGQERSSGQRDRRFRRRDSLHGVARDPRALRPSLLEVSSRIADQRLEIACIYSRNVHRRETAERLTRGVVAALGALADATLEGRGRTATPADFPDAGLSQEELNTLTDPT